MDRKLYNLETIILTLVVFIQYFLNVENKDLQHHVTFDL